MPCDVNLSFITKYYYYLHGADISKPRPKSMDLGVTPDRPNSDQPTYAILSSSNLLISKYLWTLGEEKRVTWMSQWLWGNRFWFSTSSRPKCHGSSRFIRHSWHYIWKCLHLQWAGIARQDQQKSLIVLWAGKNKIKQVNIETEIHDTVKLKRTIKGILRGRYLCSRPSWWRHPRKGPFPCTQQCISGWVSHHYLQGPSGSRWWWWLSLFLPAQLRKKISKQSVHL